MTSPPQRRRGRPVGQSDAVSRIRQSAVALFAEHGYEATSIRSIAAHTGVDAALVHHYFGTKRHLHASALDLPTDARHARHLIARVDAGEMEGLVRDVLRAWEDPTTSPLMRARLRHRIDTGPNETLDVSAMLVLAPPGRDARTAIPEIPPSVKSVAAALVGMVVGRYLLHIEPWASATAEDLVERWSTLLRAHAADAGS